MVAPEVPTGVAVGQAIFGDQTDGSLLEPTGVETIRQGQVGEVTGEAMATAEAAMAGECDKQIDGTVGPCITEVMEGTGTHSVAASAVATARAGACWPVATVPLDAWLGEVFDTSDALGDIGYVLTGTTHQMLS
jgi:hypothetical protein